MPMRYPEGEYKYYIGDTHWSESGGELHWRMNVYEKGTVSSDAALSIFAQYIVFPPSEYWDIVVKINGFKTQLSFQFPHTLKKDEMAQILFSGHMKLRRTIEEKG